MNRGNTSNSILNCKRITNRSQKVIYLETKYNKQLCKGMVYMYTSFLYKINWNGFYAFKYIYESMKIIAIILSTCEIFKTLLKNS